MEGLNKGGGGLEKRGEWGAGGGGGGSRAIFDRDRLNSVDSGPSLPNIGRSSAESSWMWSEQGPNRWGSCLSARSGGAKSRKLDPGRTFCLEVQPTVGRLPPMVRRVRPRPALTAGPDLAEGGRASLERLRPPKRPALGRSEATALHATRRDVLWALCPLTTGIRVARNRPTPAAHPVDSPPMWGNDTHTHTRTHVKLSLS